VLCAAGLFRTECAQEDDGTEAAEGLHGLRDFRGFIARGALGAAPIFIIRSLIWAKTWGLRGGPDHVSVIKASVSWKYAANRRVPRRQGSIDFSVNHKNEKIFAAFLALVIQAIGA
jgi:hypothetical protein